MLLRASCSASAAPMDRPLISPAVRRLAAILCERVHALFPRKQAACLKSRGLLVHAICNLGHVQWQLRMKEFEADCGVVEAHRPLSLLLLLL